MQQPALTRSSGDIRFTHTGSPGMAIFSAAAQRPSYSVPLLSASAKSSRCFSNKQPITRHTSFRASSLGSRWSAHKILRPLVWGRQEPRNFFAQGIQAAGQAQVTSSASVFQPASMSRVFIGVQPGRGAARLSKAGKPSGPMSLVLLLFTVAGTISAAVRSRLESAARGCTMCHGYGINRCTLCSGTGAVGWEGKWNHSEPCPMCLGKRFVGCLECGGHFHRRIFNHHHHTGFAVTKLVEAEQGMLAKLGD